MYDWANSAFQTTIIAAVFPIYFHSVVAADLANARRTSRFAWATTIAILIVALVAPLLGAIADYAAMKKKMLAAFMLHGRRARRSRCTGSTRGDWQLALTLFVIGNIGVAGSIVFYESLLPHLVDAKELDRVSSAGYAIGYLGGGVLLAINLLMIQKPAWFGIPDAGTAVRLSLASVGVWWLVFSIPLFRRVPEPPRSDRNGRDAEAATSFAIGVRRLVETFKELRRYKQAFLLLVAFLIYNDGIQTIIRMATTYGSRDRHRSERDDHGAADHAVHRRAVRVPVRHVAGRIGAKTAVFLGLAVYAFISVLGVLHDDRRALLRAGDPGRHGPGRHAGAQPLDVREHDPAGTSRPSSSRSSACSSATPASSAR